MDVGGYVLPPAEASDPNVSEVTIPPLCWDSVTVGVGASHIPEGTPYQLLENGSVVDEGKWSFSMYNRPSLPLLPVLSGMAPPPPVTLQVMFLLPNSVKTSSVIVKRSTIPNCLPGDLNHNGRVEVQDATISLRLAVASYPGTDDQKIVGDINQDGRLNIRDTLLILQYVVGSIRAFPTGSP